MKAHPIPRSTSTNVNKTMINSSSSTTIAPLATKSQSNSTNQNNEITDQSNSVSDHASQQNIVDSNRTSTSSSNGDESNESNESGDLTMKPVTNESVSLQISSAAVSSAPYVQSYIQTPATHMAPLFYPVNFYFLIEIYLKINIKR